MGKLTDACWNRFSTSFWVGVPLAVVLSGPTPLYARDLADGIVQGTTAQGYGLMSGGVGIEARNQMMERANPYDLKLSFADRAGDYLSDVKVAIEDERGQRIVDTTAAGPWFYAELPAGKYDIKATFNNRAEEIKNVAIAKGHPVARLLHWNVEDRWIAHR